MLPVLLLGGLLLAGETKPVAIVSSLSGEGWVSLPSSRRAPLQLFARLVPGSVVDVGPRSQVVVVFGDGSRLEMGPESRGTVAAGGLGRRAGPIRALDPLPPLDRLLEAEDIGHRVAAVRVRALVAVRYPRGCAATLSDSTVLRFSAPPGDWRVEVFDESGRSVFAQATETAEVRVPRGKLEAGKRYSWRAHVLDATGRSGQDEACFVTLSDDLASARAALEEGTKEADAASLALRAELDRALGLLWEAREGFQDALALSPQDAAFRDAVDRVEREMSVRREP